MLHVEKYSPRISEHIFYYDPPTNISFGGGGLIPDPYETKYLKLQKSLVPNSGNGVIARKNIPEETVAAHFSLHMYNDQEEKIYYGHNTQFHHTELHIFNCILLILLFSLESL